MISAINHRINALTALGTVPVRVRQQLQCVHRLTAGGSGHDGANQEYLRVRNSNAHPPVTFSTAAAVHNAGEPEESKGDKLDRKWK